MCYVINYRHIRLNETKLAAMKTKPLCNFFNDQRIKHKIVFNHNNRSVEWFPTHLLSKGSNQGFQLLVVTPSADTRFNWLSLGNTQQDPSHNLDPMKPTLCVKWDGWIVESAHCQSTLGTHCFGALRLLAFGTCDHFSILIFLVVVLIFFSWKNSNSFFFSIINFKSGFIFSTAAPQTDSNEFEF